MRRDKQYWRKTWNKKINLNYRFSSYRAVNACRLGYKNLSVNTTEEITAVEKYTKHMNTLCAQNVDFFKPADSMQPLVFNGVK
jgi:hypothetical protein